VAEGLNFPMDDGTKIESLPRTISGNVDLLDTQFFISINKRNI
jgi:hypothetical protein